MKNMKKLVGLLLAVLLVALSAAACADFTIKAPTNNHVYEIYQIFTGTLDQESGILTDIVWGANGKGTGAVDENTLKALDGVKNSSAAEKLDVINRLVTGTARWSIGKDLESKQVVPAGYYLIKDKANSQAGQDEAYTLNIVSVCNDVTITPKASKPTVDKLVKDEPGDKENGATQDGWGESADHSIGETFQFKLVATLPDEDHINDYATYKVKFNDTMSAGVTYKGNISVKVNGNTVDSYLLTLPNSSTAASTSDINGAKAFSLTIADIMPFLGQDNTLKNAVVEVVYDACLNSDAILDNERPNNKNTVNLEYSNNPNAGGSGEMGKTLDDTVFVFTYTMPNTKVQPNPDFNEDLEEDADTNSKYIPLKGAKFKLYSDQALQHEIKVELVSAGIYRVKTDGEAVEMESSEDGKFDIRGLDHGTYYLHETYAPAGFNTCADIVVTIAGTHIETSGGSDASTTITYTQNGTQVDSIKVLNQKGAVLPETGGMGTTMFYVVGSVLLLGAVVLLITKRRVYAD